MNAVVSAVAAPGSVALPAQPAAVPPFALDSFGFVLPALAEGAASAQLGGDREMALGALMAARLIQATLPPTSLPQPERAIRVDRARQWLSALTMPQPARMALLRTIDASLTGGLDAAASLRELMQVLNGHLTADAQNELGALAERLRLYFEQSP